MQEVILFHDMPDSEQAYLDAYGAGVRSAAGDGNTREII